MLYSYIATKLTIALTYSPDTVPNWTSEPSAPQKVSQGGSLHAWVAIGNQIEVWVITFNKTQRFV